LIIIVCKIFHFEPSVLLVFPLLTQIHFSVFDSHIQGSLRKGLHDYFEEWTLVSARQHKSIPKSKFAKEYLMAFYNIERRILWPEWFSG